MANLPIHTGATVGGGGGAGGGRGGGGGGGGGGGVRSVRTPKSKNDILVQILPIVGLHFGKSI
jgi:hypothetical protein